MESIAYYDGNVGSPDELMVPFNDRSHFFGDGVYDAAMGANGRVFLLEDHLDRFYSSAAAFKIRVPLGRDELGQLLTDLLARVEGASQFVYWQVTRGFSGQRSHAFDPDAPGKLWVLVNQEDLGDPKQPLRLITLEDHRFEYGNVKTLNLLPAVMYASQAAAAGADEAVLHRGGVVTECAHSNVQILRDADEVIVTSSSHLCTFANELDGQPVGGRDPHTLRKLQEVVYGEYRDYCGL